MFKYLKEANQIKLRPHFSEDKNISFGGKKEEDMINEFNSFDILWYASVSNEKLEKWKAFTNVDVLKISEEKDFINIVENKKKLYFIVIATGSFAEKTIPKLKKNIMHTHIIIYCRNSEHHKKWSANYKIIDGVFTQPSQIFEYLIQLQNSLFNIPLFKYEKKNQKEFNFNCYDKIEQKEIIVNKNNYSLKLNKYEKFCVHILHNFRLASMDVDKYFDNDSKNSPIKNYEYFDIFFNDSSIIIDLFYDKNENINNFQELKTLFSNKLILNESAESASELLFFFIGLTLVSLYFQNILIYLGN